MLVIAVLPLVLSCKDTGNPVDDGCGQINPGIVPRPPYDSPIWHPSGEFIGFNRWPLKKINYPYGEHCWGEQEFIADSIGFWLINADGTSMRRIFSHTLQTPAWSPDGQWVAFVSGAQIFKMRFTGTAFDTSTSTQLTFQGRNFFPTWSPNGQWIAYNKSICEGPNTCGIWLMTSAGANHRFLVDYGNYPNWHPTSGNVLYRTRAVTQVGEAIGDSLWTFNITTNQKSLVIFLGGQNNDNRHPGYSPDGTKIAFWSNSNIWIMGSNGTNLQQLTSEGVDVSFGLPLSWSPDGSGIVYTHYSSNKWTLDNGVLWVLNPNTAEKKQLTFNH